MRTLIPIIRRVMPQLLAAELIGVQPMGPRYPRSNAEILFKDRDVIVTDMIVLHVSLRPFMPPGYPEPNDHYRPWLEKNIGAQGINWNWCIHEHNIDLLEIHFADKEHATLFELAWK